MDGARIESSQAAGHSAFEPSQNVGRMHGWPTLYGDSNNIVVNNMPQQICLNRLVNNLLSKPPPFNAGSKFASKGYVYIWRIQCRVSSITQDAPKINPTFEDNFGTLNLKAMVWSISVRHAHPQ